MNVELRCGAGYGGRFADWKSAIQQELMNNRSLSNAERNAAMKQLQESNFKQFSELVGERAAKAFQRNRGVL